ncbi:hypothetical protein BDV10DRAFT_183398 [Aspergillus recurvatus]
MALALFALALGPVLAAPVSNSNTDPNINITALFGPSLSPSARIYLPSDPEYTTAITQRASTYDEPEYIAAIKPATEEDVQAIVRIATNRSLPFLATGGGHASGPGYETVQHAIDIDLGNFNTTRLDTEANTLTVGGSTQFGQIYDILYDAGKELQTGNAPCVNLVGATIAAGVGPLQGLHGLIIDALLSVRLVTASGELLTVSDESHPDLFWAIRGAGANFGIITSATYRVHEATNDGQVLNADFLFPAEANRSVYEVLASWDDDETFPREMALGVGASVRNGSATLSASLVFFGPQSSAQPYIDTLLRLNPTRFQNLTVPWPRLASVTGFGRGDAACTRGGHSIPYSVGAAITQPAAFSTALDSFVSFSAQNSWYAGSFVVQRSSSAAATAVPERRRGVYPWRDIKMQLLMTHIAPDASYDEEIEGFAGPVRDELWTESGFEQRRTYLGYGHGDEGARVWFGEENLGRLGRLKREWDPDRVFGAGNPVPV